MQTGGWNVIDEQTCVLWREYSFAGAAMATTMVFRGVDGLVVVSPGRGLAALRKKAPGIAFRPLTELALPAHVRCDDPPGFKTGETLISIRTCKGTVWFTGDLLTNMQRVPGPPLRRLFTWTDSAPGFRLFKPAVWLMVRDKQAVRAWVLQRLASDPPTMIVPAHGPMFAEGDVAGLARAQIERL